MHRKGFLSFIGSSIASSLVVSPLSSFSNQAKNITAASIVPPYLKKGDTIGVTCPAGFITLEAIQPSLKLMQDWGYKIKLGSTVGKRDFSFGGSDAERLQDMQAMINDRSVKAIMCARGGYGAVRTIDKLVFEKLLTNPKWIIGFSDITVIHSHIFSNYRLASIHSKMCNSFPDDWSLADPIQVDTILSIRNALSGQRMTYQVPPHAQNRPGTAKGLLTGGNLKTLETLTGTKSDLITEGCILFVEDTNENLYSIDRMFRHLKRSGKLSKLAGIVIGGFKIKPDDPGEEFGRTLYDIVWDQVREYSYPLCFDFPVGHQKNNYAVKCGVMHELKVSTASVSLQEIIRTNG